MKMERKLYVLSKPLERGPRLIGVLTEKDGEFEFEYKMSGTVKEWFMVINEFPDVRKKYKGDAVKKFINRFILSKDDPSVDKLLNYVGLKEYDTWELLKARGHVNVRGDAYLCESIPQGAIIYEKP